jgi:hypothetical protein
MMAIDCKNCEFILTGEHLLTRDDNSVSYYQCPRCDRVTANDYSGKTWEPDTDETTP